MKSSSLPKEDQVDTASKLGVILNSRALRALESAGIPDIKKEKKAILGADRERRNGALFALTNITPEVYASLQQLGLLR